MKFNELREKVMLNMHEKKLSVEPMSLQDLKDYVALNKPEIENLSTIKKKRMIETIAEFEVKIDEMEREEEILTNKIREIPKIRALFVIKNTQQH